MGEAERRTSQRLSEIILRTGTYGGFLLLGEGALLLLGEDQHHSVKLRGEMRVPSDGKPEPARIRGTVGRVWGLCQYRPIIFSTIQLLPQDVLGKNGCHPYPMECFGSGKKTLISRAVRTGPAVEQFLVVVQPP